MRLLLVEDEPGLRDQLASRLQEAGYTVSSAADGEEGLHLASEYPFDAAIIDLGLPRLPGIELIRRELEARVHALLRRAAGWASSTLEFGALCIDTRGKQVTVAGDVVELTAYEYNVLEYLAVHTGKAISKSELTEHIYDQDFDRDSNVIEVFVGRLRRKLDPDGTLAPIETVRGQGYRFALAATSV